MSQPMFRGVALMVSANLVFCIMACFVRALSDLNAWTTTLFRFLLGMGFVCVYAMSGKIKLQFINSKGLFVRGIIGGAATAMFFYSITKIGLVRAGFFASLYPVFAVVFGHVILKERLTPVKWSALAISLCGVALLMLDGTSGGGKLSGISRYDIVAICASMLAGLTVVFIKKLQSTDSTIAIFFAQCLIGAGIVFIPASVQAVAIAPGALVMLLMVGVLATVGQLMLTDSFKYLSVATGSLLVMTTPVFNCMAGVFLFNESLSLLTGVGALVILGSSAWMLMDKG